MNVYVVLKHRRWPFGIEPKWMNAGEIVGVFTKKEDAEAAKKKTTDYSLYSITRKVLK